jgi:oligopeptide transport system permease protein
MAQYIVGRVLWAVPVLFFISLATFALMHAIEGGPWDDEKQLPPAIVQNLNHRYNLDQPLWRQYAGFAWNALQGDLGRSYQGQDRPVTEIILRGFRASAVLGGIAAGLALAVGIGMGVAAAAGRRRRADRLMLLFAGVTAGMPAFVLAIILIYVFGVKLRLLPVYGWGSPQQAVLPVIALAVAPAAFIARLTRASMLDVLGQDYMRTALAKGLGTRPWLFRHALRNAIVPVLAAFGPLAISYVTGSFIVEYLFSIPGSGRLFVTAVAARDYGMILGVSLFYAVLVLVGSLAVDVVSAAIDPRLRSQA